MPQATIKTMMLRCDSQHCPAINVHTCQSYSYLVPHLGRWSDAHINEEFCHHHVNVLVLFADSCPWASTDK